MHPVTFLFDEIYREYWGIPAKRREPERQFADAPTRRRDPVRRGPWK